LKSLIFHILNFKSWIKLIYDKITYIYCVLNEFNPTFDVQNMRNEAFQNALFGNASFPNEAFSYSYLWALAPNATVTPILEILALKSDFFDMRHLVKTFLHCSDMNCTGWIKLFFDSVDLCKVVINEFHPTCDVQGNGNWVF